MNDIIFQHNIQDLFLRRSNDVNECSIVLMTLVGMEKLPSLVTTVFCGILWGKGDLSISSLTQP